MIEEVLFCVTRFHVGVVGLGLGVFLLGICVGSFISEMRS